MTSKSPRRRRRSSASQIARQRAGVGRDEDAPAAEHGIAAEARSRADESEVVGCVPRRGDRSEGTDLAVVAELDVDVASTRRQPGAGKRSSRARDGLGVIAVVVGQDDAAEAAPLARAPPRWRSMCSSSSGPGSTTQAGSRPDHPGVRPGQGQRRGVRRPHQQDVVAREAARRGTPRRPAPRRTAAGPFTEDGGLSMGATLADAPSGTAARSYLPRLVSRPRREAPLDELRPGTARARAARARSARRSSGSCRSGADPPS